MYTCIKVIYICVGMGKETHTQQTIITVWLPIIHICIVSHFIIFIFYTHKTYSEGNFKMRNTHTKTKKLYPTSIRVALFI